MFDRSDTRTAVISLAVSGFTCCAVIYGPRLISDEQPSSPASTTITYPMGTSIVFRPTIGGKNPLDLMLSPTGFDVYICQMTVGPSSKDFPDAPTRAAIAPLAGELLERQFGQNAANFTDPKNPIAAKMKWVCDANLESRRTLTKAQDELRQAQNDFNDCANKPVNPSKPKCVEEGQHLRDTIAARMGSGGNIQKVYVEEVTKNFRTKFPTGVSIDYHYGYYGFSEPAP